MRSLLIGQLTLHFQTVLVCILSILFSIQILRYWNFMNGRELHWLTTISVVRHIQTLLPRSINIKGPLAPLVNHLREICFSSSHNLGRRKNSESPSSFMWSLRFTSSTSTRRRVVSEFTGYLWEEASSRNEWWNAAHKRLEMYRAKRAAMKQT